MPTGTTLCEHCSRVDFNSFRHPTLADIQSLNAGDMTLEDRLLVEDSKSSKTGTSWSLGLVSRIRSSGTHCPFCKAVTIILDQNPDVLRDLVDAGLEDPYCHASPHMTGRLQPAEGNTWKMSRDNERYLELIISRLQLSFHPSDEGYTGRSDEKGPGWRRLLGCLQIYDEQNPWTPSNAEEIFKQPLDPRAICFAGRKRGASLDMRLPMQWLKHCQSSHGMSCGSTLGSMANADSLMPLFRLIDVRDRAIVDFTNVNLGDLNYTALSYVWGKTPQRITLVDSNYDSLHKSGSLCGQVSQTIEDSFQFTAMMGVQYIWVDAICIIQNSDDDKKLQIGRMADVYARAVLAIIAAGSEDAQAGLPGVSVPRTDTQEVLTFEVPGSSDQISFLTMLKTSTANYEHPSLDTVWATRGWTLQERAVAPRSVMFLQEQAIWACCQSHWTEETWSESAPAVAAWFNLAGSEYYLNSKYKNDFATEIGNDQMWYKIQHLVNDYSRRNLSVQGDAHDAFSAILQQAQSMSRESFLWGIPASRFELGLCWEPDRRGLVRRYELTTLPTTSFNKRVPFPSWSWLGWKGAVSLMIEDQHIEAGLDPIILCYTLRNNPLRLVQVRRLFTDGWRGPRQPSIPIAQGSLGVSLDHVKDNYGGLTIGKLADVFDDQLLFFWAESARFQVTDPIKSDNWRPEWNKFLIKRFENYHQGIKDSHGSKIGEIGRCKEGHDAGASKGGEYEFIVIAVRKAPPEYEETRIALQIGRRADGIAYRINIAEISQAGWEQANVTFGLVALGSETGIFQE